MRWLRQLLLSLRHLLPTFPLNPEPAQVAVCLVPNAPDWITDDRARWFQFLRSETGRKLIARARAVHYAAALRASEDLFHTQHSAGVAKGFGDAIKWFESLSLVPRDSGTAGPVDAADDADVTGQNNDTQPPGEAALRELMSP